MRDPAEIANDIFDLDLDWSYSDHERILPPDDVDRFSALCSELVRSLTNSEFHSAVWFLSQARHVIGYEEAEGECRSLELTPSHRKRLLEALRFSIDAAIGKEIPELPSGGQRLWLMFREEDDGGAFEALLRAERKVLAASGLNQKSVAIIVDRLSQYRTSIGGNIAANTSVGQNALIRSTLALETLSKRPLWRLQSRKLLEASASNWRNRLIDSKDKVIGLTTMWADALPLLVARDWGIASVFSTVAGATVAAVLPRRSPD